MLFRTVLCNILGHEIFPEDTNDKLMYLISLIIDAANLTSKIRKPSLPNSKPTPPWWDDECFEMSKQRRSAFSLYRASSTLQSYILYKNSDALCKRTFMQKARVSWRQFCSSLNSQSNPSAVWNRVKKKSYQTSGSRTANS